MSTETLTIPHLLLSAAEREPDRTALAFPGDRRSYGRVLDDSLKVAHGLSALGVRPGDHVGILMPNCPDFVASFFGCQLLGAVAVTINARYQARELSYVIERSDIVVLLTTDLIAEHVNFVDRILASVDPVDPSGDPTALSLPTTPRLQSIVVLGTERHPGLVDQPLFDSLAAKSGRSSIEVPEDADATAMMLFTSGTSSYPKGCLLSHRSMVHTWRAVGARFGASFGERVWNPCPMFHMSGIGPLLFTTDLCGTLSSQIHFDPEAALVQLEEERPQIMYPAFPTLTMAIVKRPGWRTELMDGVRVIQNVAPPETLRDMQSLFPGTTQFTAYGMTETSGIASITDLGDPEEARMETCGLPIPGAEFRIVDPETGVDLPDGERGEILVRGEVRFQGYYRDDDDNAAIDPEGWLHTGDLGRRSHDGRISYLGRSKDMLKVGGENVAPAEIEAHLSTHPAVRLAQVIGVPDDVYHEVPVAFVELIDGRRVTEAELVAHCQGHLAGFKIPRAVRFITEWPLSATKVQKFRLLELWQAENGDDGA
jgi:fatty-acyl-CoA synthase